MPRYIDAEKMRDDWLYRQNENMYCPNDVLDSIDEQPTADVAPVVHAHWEREEDYEGTHHICSNCRSKCPSVLTAPATVDRPYGEVEEIELSDIVYCPACGAKMDEK